MSFFINRAIDTLIALSLLLGAILFFSNDDSDEYEAEISPVEAKVQQYCARAEFNDDVPLNIKKACLERKKKFDTEQEFEPAARPEHPYHPESKILYRT
jgi:hypothetical protein